MHVAHTLVCDETFADIQNLHLSISSEEMVSIVDALPSDKFAGRVRTMRDGVSEVKFVHVGEDESLYVDGSAEEMNDVQYPMTSSERYSSVCKG